MLRRAVVHVGLPRTGTTTLQRVLCRLRPELAAKGVLYPDLTPPSAAEPHLSHQHLGEALDGRRSAQDLQHLLANLSAQLAATDADMVVLSYEGLCRLPAWLGVPRRLATLFAQHGFAMEIMATLKPQGDLLNSTYTWRTQFLRETRPFTAFFRAGIGDARMDFGATLRPWMAACDGRLLAVPTLDPRSGRPLLTRIFDEMGLLPRLAGFLGPDDLTLVENRSPGPVAVEVSRQLRRGGAHLALGPAARAATRFVEEAARARGVNAVAFQGLDPALQAAAEARWGVANERFAQQVWGAPWPSRAAARPGSPSNELARLPDAGEAGRQAADILRQTCERYQLRLEGGWRPALRNAAGAVGGRLDGVIRSGRALRSGWAPGP